MITAGIFNMMKELSLMMESTEVFFIRKWGMFSVFIF